MAQTKPLRDWFYLGLIAIQLVAIIALDSTVFLPPSLWLEPDAPLHFLITIRESYHAFSGDPYYANDISLSTHNPRSWFDAFLLMQILIELPFTIYISRFLRDAAALPPAAELAMLVHGILLSTTTATCLYEARFFTEQDLPADKFDSLVWGTYAPFAIIPALMVVDMYMRLLGRFEETKAKTQ